jgi:hypothetical protein
MNDHIYPPYVKLRHTLEALVFKIRAEEHKGQPLHAMGHEDSPWTEESGYPSEYSRACQLVDEIVKAEEAELLATA